ncbi:MAG: hypothetical protein WCH39_03255 [Schlesneria sp.]
MAENESVESAINPQYPGKWLLAGFFIYMLTMIVCFAYSREDWLHDVILPLFCCLNPLIQLALLIKQFSPRKRFFSWTAVSIFIVTMLLVELLQLYVEGLSSLGAMERQRKYGRQTKEARMGTDTLA